MTQPEKWVHEHLFDTVFSSVGYIPGRGLAGPDGGPGPASVSEQPPSVFWAQSAGVQGRRAVAAAAPAARGAAASGFVAGKRTGLVHAPAPSTPGAQPPARSLQPTSRRVRGATGFSSGAHPRPLRNASTARPARVNDTLPPGSTGDITAVTSGGRKKNARLSRGLRGSCPKQTENTCPAKESRVGKRLLLKNGGDLPEKVCCFVSLLLRLGLCLRAGMAWEYCCIRKIAARSLVHQVCYLRNFSKKKKKKAIYLSRKKTSRNNRPHTKDIHDYDTECTNYRFPGALCNFTLTAFILLPDH